MTAWIASPARRQLLATAAAGLLALGAVGAQLAHAQGTPVRVGLLLAKQGTFTELGAAQAAGAEIAVQQAGGKVLGRPVEVIWYDEANPQMAQQNFDKLVQEDKVVGVVGGGNSATALATASNALRAKIPYIVSSGAAREITGKECNRYTFRILPTVPTIAAALTPAMLESGKDWYIVVSSYAYGQDVRNAFKSELLKAGGKEVGFDLIPGGTTDFSSVVVKIKQAQPKMVLIGLGGADSISFLKQYNEFGLHKSIPVFGSLVSDSHMWGLGDKAIGTFGKPWQYSDPANSDAEKAFTKAYIAKVGKPPMAESWQGWIAMRMLLAGIEQAKTTDSRAIVQALETMRIPNGSSPTYFRAWDHQLIHPLLVVRGHPGKPNDKWDMLETVRKVPANMADLEKVYGAKEEIGCPMGDF